MTLLHFMLKSSNCGTELEYVVNVALVVKKFIRGHVPTKKKWLNCISVIVSVLTGSILYEFERLAGWLF